MEVNIRSAMLSTKLHSEIEVEPRLSPETIHFVLSSFTRNQNLLFLHYVLIKFLDQGELE